MQEEAIAELKTNEAREEGFVYCDETNSGSHYRKRASRRSAHPGSGPRPVLLRLQLRRHEHDVRELAPIGRHRHGQSSGRHKTRLGRDPIRYESIFSGPAKVHVEYFDYTIHDTAEMFYAVGRERGYFRLGGEEVILAIRTSRIFGKVGNRWKQVHHHGSIEDPQMLAQYQSVVLGKKS